MAPIWRMPEAEKLVGFSGYGGYNDITGVHKKMSTCDHRRL